MAQLGKNLPAMRDTWVQSLGWEDPLEKGKATHSSILASRISWTASFQASLSRGFSRQNYWSRLPFLPPGDLPNPESEPLSLVSPALAGGFFTTSAAWEATVQAAFVFSQIICSGRSQLPCQEKLYGEIQRGRN